MHNFAKFFRLIFNKLVRTDTFIKISNKSYKITKKSKTLLKIAKKNTSLKVIAFSHKLAFDRLP